MMTLQERLSGYELELMGWPDTVWDLREWPSPEVKLGVRLHRLWRLVGEDQVMLHRFSAAESVRDQVPHPHPMAVVAHVLGGGSYEVGFGAGGVCQARFVVGGDFYYEMRTRDVEHFLYPTGGPIYTVCLWTQYPAVERVPSDRLVVPDPADLLTHVQGCFDRTWGPVEAPRVP